MRAGESNPRDLGPVVIIGAGIAGLATAYHLSRRGVREITICEREPQIAMHASGRNAAIFRLLGDDRWNVVMAQETYSLLQQEAWGREIIRTGGALTIAAAGKLPLLHRWSEVSRAEGVECPELSTDAAVAMVPALAGQEISGVLHAPGEGTIDIHGLVHQLLAGAREQGARLLLGCGVRSVQTTGSQVSGVVTDAGQLPARVVINAAGAWSRDLGRQAGAVLLPLRAVRRHLAFLRAQVPQSWPVVWDLSAPHYFRPESGGLLMCLCEELPCQPGDESNDENYGERLARVISRLRLPFGDAELARVWACQRTMTPDDRFVVGADPQLRGFYWVTGFGGHGMSAGLSAGRIAADVLLGAPTAEAEVLSPGRFGR